MMKYNERFVKGLNQYKRYRPSYVVGGYENDEPIEAISSSDDDGIFSNSYLPTMNVIGKQQYPIVTQNSNGDIIGAKFTGERKNLGNRFDYSSQKLISPQDFSKYRLSLARQNDANHTHKLADAVQNGVTGLMFGIDAPLMSIGAMVGSAAGEDIDKKLGGNGTTGAIIGGLVSPIGVPLGIRGAKEISRISRNIKNRNLLAYNYIEPRGYINVFSRAKNYLKGILKDDVRKYNPLDNPKHYKIKSVFGKTFDDFRDEAWRKYLGLPSRKKLYVPNKDGSFSYNLDLFRNGEYKETIVPDFISHPNSKRKYEDWLTGAGGMLHQDSKITKLGEINEGDYMISRYNELMKDRWDLNPFRATNKLNDLYDKKVIEISDKIYKKLYNPVYKNKYGYKFLGGRYLNKLRYGDVNVPFKNIINKLYNRIKDYEVGPILKGKPFDMKTNVNFRYKIPNEKEINRLIKEDIHFDLFNPGTLIIE